MTDLMTALPDLAAAAAWAPSLAWAFVNLACDFALVLDPQGIIVSVAHADVAGLAPLVVGWVGRHWVDTMTRESQPKAEGLLADVAQHGVAPRREVTLAHLTRMPVAFTAMRLGQGGPTLVVGHDLRTAARLQQRFIVAQRDLEQGYQLAMDRRARLPTLPH